MSKLNTHHEYYTTKQVIARMEDKMFLQGLSLHDQRELVELVRRVNAYELEQKALFEQAIIKG